MTNKILLYFVESGIKLNSSLLTYIIFDRIIRTNIFVLRMHHFFFLDSIANIDNPSTVRVVAATFLLPYIVVELKVLKEKYVFTKLNGLKQERKALN